MWKKFSVTALAVLAFGFVSAPRSYAGTEMIIDNSAQTYNYSAPPVYYAPPPVRVVVYPTYSYYARPFRVFGYQRFHGRRGYCAPRRW